VQFSTDGTTIEIWDPTMRSFSGFDSLAGSTSLASTAVTISTVAGKAAVSSTNPGNTNAVFRGDSRINDTNIVTRDNAFVAIDRLAKAVDAINKERAAMGAVMNRLTYAADNLSNTSLNVSESRSRIQDADYAKASSELARTQIISQAATAVLAQANVDQQTVLKLLNG
jgi:flagellin